MLTRERTEQRVSEASLEADSPTIVETEAIEAWRCWKVSQGRLASPFMAATWRAHVAHVAAKMKWANQREIKRLIIVAYLWVALWGFGFPVYGIVWQQKYIEGGLFAGATIISLFLLRFFFNALTLPNRDCEDVVCEEHSRCNGIYGTKELPRIARISLLDDYFVIGRAFFWGKVIEYDNGFKSEFAYPSRIYQAQCTRCVNLRPINMLKAAKGRLPICADDWRCDPSWLARHISNGMRDKAPTYEQILALNELYI